MVREERPFRRNENEVAPGIEPGIEALQASALPLGDATLNSKSEIRP